MNDDATLARIKKLEHAAEIARTDLSYASTVDKAQSWRYEQSIKMLTAELGDVEEFDSLKRRWEREEAIEVENNVAG